MKKNLRQQVVVLLGFIMIFVTAFGMTTLSVWAEDNDGIIQADITVTYDQTGARSMLDNINALRADPNVWVWAPPGYDEDIIYYNQRQGVEGYPLQPLVIDKELEKIAMQRAAEIAFSYYNSSSEKQPHYRPNGEYCNTYYESIDYLTDASENISFGGTFNTAAAAYEGFLEEDKDYNGQGHRRNMLMPWKAVGIAHVNVGGVNYWVQVFGDTAGEPNTDLPDANDSQTDVTIDILESKLSNISVTNDPVSISLNAGEEAELPVTTAKVTVDGSAQSTEVVKAKIKLRPTWASANTSIAAVSGDKVSGVKEGTTTLNASDVGSIDVPAVTVNVTGTPSGGNDGGEGDEGDDGGEGDEGDDPGTPVVTPISIAAPSSQAFTYDGKTHTGVAQGEGYTLSGITTATNAGSYTVRAALNDGYCWADGTTAAKSITWKINKATAKVTVPKGNTFTYNGKAKTGVAAGTNYTLTGTVKATKAGTYTAKATLKTNANYIYKWADGTAAAKTIKWKINKAANPLTIKAKKATIKYTAVKKKAQVVGVTKVIAFTKKGQGKMTYTKASGNKNITIAKTTGKVTVKKGLKKGTYSVKVKVKAGGNANYKASSVKNVTFKIKVK